MAAIILGGMVVQPIISKLSVMMSKNPIISHDVLSWGICDGHDLSV